MLEISLSAVGWMDFLVVARMDIDLGNMKAYQRLKGVFSVMKRIEIYCNCKYQCPHLPKFTMLLILLT